METVSQLDESEEERMKWRKKSSEEEKPKEKPEEDETQGNAKDKLSTTEALQATHTHHPSKGVKSPIDMASEFNESEKGSKATRER